MKFLPTLQLSKIHIFFNSIFGLITINLFSWQYKWVSYFHKILSKNFFNSFNQLCPEGICDLFFELLRAVFFFFFNLANVIKRAPAGHAKPRFGLKSIAQ